MDVTPPPAEVRYSSSTWQQPVPPPGSAERRRVVQRVADRILELGPGRLRVGIDGRTAAGKTSFGHELAERIVLQGRPVLRACLDDFKRPWRDRHLYDRESGEGYYRNAFDYGAVADLLLEPCGPTGSSPVALCSIDPLTQRDHSGEVIDVTDDAVLLVDGVFAFRPEIDDHWDLRIWLAIDADMSVSRGSIRDRDWAGSDAEALHRDRYGVAEDFYVAEVDPIAMADVVIDNADLQHPRILRG